MSQDKDYSAYPSMQNASMYTFYYNFKRSSARDFFKIILRCRPKGIHRRMDILHRKDMEFRADIPRRKGTQHQGDTLLPKDIRPRMDMAHLDRLDTRPRGLVTLRLLLDINQRVRRLWINQQVRVIPIVSVYFDFFSFFYIPYGYLIEISFIF